MDSEAARKTYNRVGRFQDTQAFYEAAAVAEMLTHMRLPAATNVVELGCGTGKLAKSLLRAHMSERATYIGVDVSDKMCELASDAVAEFGDRAQVMRADVTAGTLDLGEADRVISTYVLDLMGDEQRAALLDRANELLRPTGGLLGVASIGHGASGVSALVSRAWTALAQKAPSLVGGCQPRNLADEFQRDDFVIEHHERMGAWGVTSEIVIARAVT